MRNELNTYSIFIHFYLNKRREAKKEGDVQRREWDSSRVGCMTFVNKLLAYLGFCPRKESAQSFKVKSDTITSEQSVAGVGFILILILLVNASNVLAGTMTVDTILRLFSISIISLMHCGLLGKTYRSDLATP